MKQFLSNNRFFQWIKLNISRLWITLLLLMPSTLVWADKKPVIPISGDDQTDSNQDFTQTLITIMQKDAIPIIMIIAGIWAVWTAITTVAGGVNESRTKQDWTPLKDALIKAGIVVVVVGALIFLLTYIQKWGNQ